MRRKMAMLAVALSALISQAVAQEVRSESLDSRERIGTPSSKPLPVKRVGDDPRKIFQRLISESSADRQTVAKQLGWQTDEVTPSTDARLIITNLDSDDEPELIFVLSGLQASTTAFVFDHQQAGWMQVGEFDYDWHWDANLAEEMIGLREIVQPGRKEILVRTSSGGTGIAQTDLTIFRLHEGRLYKVFGVVESSSRDVCCGTPDTGSGVEDKRELTYADESDNGPFILVRHTRTKSPPGRPRLVGCTAFRWTPERFSFEVDKPASARLCALK